MRNPFLSFCLLLLSLFVSQTSNAQHPLIDTIGDNSARHAFEQGNTHFDNSDWAAAADWWRKATELSPQMDDAWYNLALAYFKMKDFEETERLSEKTLQINPSHTEAHGLLGTALHHQGAHKKAIEAFNKMPKESRTEELLLTKATCYIADGQPQQALPDLDSILQSHPGHTRACIIKSAALIDLYQYNYAIRFLNRVLDFEPTHNEALTNRAICHFHLGKKELAYADFNKALGAKPALPTLLARGKCLLAEGRFQKAMADAKLALSIDADSPDVYYLLGEIELCQSKYEHAIKSLEVAHDLDHTCIDCLMLKNEALAHLSRFEEAVQNIYGILETDPENTEARKLLLWIYTQMDVKNTTEKEVGRS